MDNAIAPVDAATLEAWISGRSRARGHPMPVAIPGGFRVATAAGEERRRYLFTGPCPALRRIARCAAVPQVAVKLCAGDAALRDCLTPRWVLQPSAWLMTADGALPLPAPTMPPGYRLDVTGSGGIATALIHDAHGALAASGHAAEWNGHYVYDRIATDPAHRRRGLGRALMAALGDRRSAQVHRQLLVATAMGRSLYRAIGWVDRSPYATAIMPSA